MRPIDFGDVSQTNGPEKHFLPWTKWPWNDWERRNHFESLELGRIHPSDQSTQCLFEWVLFKPLDTNIYLRAALSSVPQFVLKFGNRFVFQHCDVTAKRNKMSCLSIVRCNIINGDQDVVLTSKYLSRGQYGVYFVFSQCIDGVCCIFSVSHLRFEEKLL